MNTDRHTPFDGKITRRIFAVGALHRQALWRCFDPSLFMDRLMRLMRHIRRWSVVYLTCAVGILWFNEHYTVALNITESLPHRLFLIHRGELPKRGDLVAFRWIGGGPYPVGSTFIKEIAGVSGDMVTQVDRNYFINGHPVGRAKSTSRQGIELKPGPTGTLLDGTYYVRAPHPDSLDSRYALTGWVSQAQIIGRAHVLF